MQRKHNFFRELRRRRVFRTAGLYIVAAWALLQVCDLAFESFGLPDEALRYVWIAAIAGLPLALLFGWRYDVTAAGVRRTPPPSGDASPDTGLKGPDYAILSAVAVLAIVFAATTVYEIRQGPLRGAGPWYASSRLATAIAVLPLENLSGDDAQEYLAAGLHDTLISTLARITRLRVTSRFSTRQLDRTLSFPDIGETLGVDKLLTGSVLQEGDRVRVNVTLVDLPSELPIWSDSFTREFDGLISMQNEIASAVAREVKVRLTAEEEQALAASGGSESDTYEAYLRGMFQLRKGTFRGYRQAIDIFTEAVEDNPTSALAYAGLAIGYAQLGHSPFPAAGAYPRARQAARRALELDADLAEAHLATGMSSIYYEWDFDAGEAAFLRALELNPSLVDAHYHYAWLLELRLRDEEAIAYGEHASELNPLSPFYSSWLADQYRDAGRYEEAIEEAETTLELDPDYPVAWVTLGQTYADMGRFDEAIEAHENLRGNRFWGFLLASTLATAGRDEDASRVLEFIDNGKNNAFTLSLIYAGMQRTDQALEWLETAKEEKIPWFPWLVAWYPQTRYLHDHPRMQEFAAELGIEFPPG